MHKYIRDSMSELQAMSKEIDSVQDNTGVAKSAMCAMGSDIEPQE